MKALRSFTVRTELPEHLASLQTLATNLRWSWDDQSRRLFRWVDPDLWERVDHDPVRLLTAVSPKRLEELGNDPAFVAFLDEIHDDLKRYLESPGWLQLRGQTPLRSVAYFSPEFGISEALPQYSGGLGVLAGDHLKAASGLALPLTGIGLFYRQGYFRQTFTHDGYQQEQYPVLDPHTMALSAMTKPDGNELTITVDLAGVPLTARIWRAAVGRITLYLLDADIDANTDDGRSVTDRLYGGGEEKRIRQEILLGIGGVRALAATNTTTQVFHTNEGHAGFLGLERIRIFMTQHGLSFSEAIEASRAGTVFTTHTPVPAGIDRFPRALMEKYFTGWCAEVGISFDEFMSLGHEPGDAADAPFNMAVMGLRLAGQANGVSKLHGSVSREMFADLWPGVPVDEVPIGSVTNGVHARTWTSLEMGELFARYVLPEWPEAGADRWARIHDCPDDVLWKVKDEGRSRLVRFVRDRARAAAHARGLAGDLTWCDTLLDPRALTIGFSRRFATYKRATLLLSDPERFKRLLLDPERPVQFVFAGKAHPADQLGKELIKQLWAFAADPAVRHRIAIVENYDIGVARMLYQGSDVWLNNPRRPMEACGTSGEKATLNGALNLSVLDGWWDEMALEAKPGRPANGWSIPSAELAPTVEDRDRAEANSLFELLEREVVPLFYDRPNDLVPTRWVFRVKTSLETLGHQVMASRMVKDYTTDYYEPAARRADATTLDAAKSLAGWKSRMRAEWPQVRIANVEFNGPDVANSGASQTATATVELGSLASSDVRVELIHGTVGLNDELTDTVVVPMTHVANSNTFTASWVADRGGRNGFTVRVVPANPLLATWAEVGVASWAS